MNKLFNWKLFFMQNERWSCPGSAAGSVVSRGPIDQFCCTWLMKATWKHNSGGNSEAGMQHLFSSKTEQNSTTTTNNCVFAKKKYISPKCVENACSVKNWKLQHVIDGMKYRSWCASCGSKVAKRWIIRTIRLDSTKVGTKANATAIQTVQLWWPMILNTANRNSVAKFDPNCRI